MPSDTELIRACKLWDKITEKMRNREYEMPEELEHAGENNPYSSGDYNEIKCQIDGKVAELTVGSSTGHKAHVDLEKKTVDYYDNDEDPNQVMNELLESTGLRCKVDSYGLKCTGVNKENVQAVFKVLAMPTSMDFRLQHCKEETRPDPTEPCQDQCSEALEEEYKLPDGCDCSSWTDDCIQECIDNWEYDDEETDCQQKEKEFFESGPKKEELTKHEAEIIPRSQKKITQWE